MRAAAWILAAVFATAGPACSSTDNDIKRCLSKISEPKPPEACLNQLISTIASRVEAARDFLGQDAADDLLDKLCMLTVEAIDSEVAHSSRTVPLRRPTIQWTALCAKLRRILVEVPLSTSGAQPRAFASFDQALPCGPDNDGLTICGSGQTFPAENLYIMSMLMSEEVPLDHPTRMHQFSFVFDSDANAANNWVPAPAFPNDFFKDTDLWYVANYDPNGGWSLDVSRVIDGTSTEAVTTPARIAITGNAVTLYAPASDFATECPPYRVTTFTHSGDYGIDPPHDWSGDVEPSVDQPLDTSCNRL